MQFCDRDIPSSFQCSDGSIHYNINAHIRGQNDHVLTLTREIKVRAPFEITANVSNTL